MVRGLTVLGPEDARILRDVDLNLRGGEILGLIGETGSGKTTFINAVLGLLPPELYVPAGSVLLETDDQAVDLLDLEERQLHDYLGLHIGYVPQDVRAGLNPLMTARGSVLESARRRPADARQRAERALRKAGLPDEFLNRDADRRPYRLSGGQCQRVLIAQAIVNDPRVLLLDEPTASLDPLARTSVLQTIRSLADEHCAVCLVSHDIAAVSRVVDTVAVMYSGRVVEVGSATQVFGQPRHPYTRALLDCVPRIDRRRAIVAIPGEIPVATANVPGCRFHSRCPLSETACRAEAPRLHSIAPNHDVACHVVQS